MRAGMGSMGGQFGNYMRSFRKDESVTSVQITKGTAKRMFKYARPYRSLLMIFLVVIVIDSLINVANPLIYRGIINIGILKKETSVIITLAFVIGLLAVFDAIISVIQRYISAKIGENLIFKLRSEVYGHIQKMPIAFFTRTQTGALVSRLDSDVLGAQQAFTDILSSVISNIVTVVLVLASMLILSWQITLVSLVILPVFIFPAKKIGRLIGKLAREGYSLNAQLSSLMIERFNVSGAILVKIFGNPNHEIGLFESRAAKVRDIGIKQAMYGRFFLVILTLVASLATAVVYGWGGVLAVRGSLSVGTVVALTAYLNRLYGPLTSLSNVQVDIMTALVSFDRVFEVLDLKPLIDEPSNPKKLVEMPPSIVFEDVNFSYPTADQVSLASLESVAILQTIDSGQVLNDLSFKVEPGSMVALVGHSGAGKTTISSLIARLYDPTSGLIKIGNVDLKDISLNDLRSTIGMVTQDSHLFHDTIKANLLFANHNATEKDLYEVLEQAQILDLINSLPEKLDTVVGDRGYRLSGGEKQRLAIARLLLKKPQIVILDEATAHLDSESELLVQTALSNALNNRTSVVIAHRLSTIQKADNILVIDEGRLVQSGKHSALINEPGLYSELYRIQFLGEGNVKSSVQH
jgi:ATP-binding cassette subfamily B protein